MNIKVYQSFYEEKQKEFIDPDFIPFDNLKNEHPQLQEIPLHREIYSINADSQDTIWGLVSWRWKDKAKINGKTFINWIEKNPGYDMYHMQPYADVPIKYINPFVQGEIYHKGMIDYFQKLCNKLGADIDIANYEMNPYDFSYCTYWVGNRLFWYNWFTFFDHCMKITMEDDEMRKYVFEIGFLHRPDSKLVLNYLPFVHERLISIYMLLTKSNLKYLCYPYDKMYEGAF